MAIPPNIEYVISEWRKFLIRSTTYKWHGVLGKCPKDFYMVVNYIASVKDKTPPIYYDYHFSGVESHGGVVIHPEALSGHFQNFDGGIFLWKPSLVNKPYDALVVDWYVDVPQGCVEFNLGCQGLGACVYGAPYPYCVYYEIYHKLITQIFSGSSIVKSFYPLDFKPKPAFRYYSDLHLYRYGCADGPLSDYVINYRLSFKKDPVTNKYDIWDNYGNVKNGVSNLRLNCYQHFKLVINNQHCTPDCFSGWCFYVDKITAYSGLF